MVGRARFEMVDYAEAARAFERARRVDPTRLAGMEVYSTVLWHLKREVELSFLAQEMLALDRLSPQAWYVCDHHPG
jgi:anaphase-promoting complex subunit 3